MDLNATPSGERFHIGIFGMRNAGKSSLINALTEQNAALVSPRKGTTTDPVAKAMEILPLGPVLLIDTPGIDDTGELGALRVERTYQVLKKSDMALLVIDATQGIIEKDIKLWQQIQNRNIPAFLLLNKADALSENARTTLIVQAKKLTDNFIFISTFNKNNIYALKEKLANVAPLAQGQKLLGDFLPPKATVILVTPIDSSAPKGRLILPQQQVIREILDHGSMALTVRPEELKITLDILKHAPALVVTDSQAFAAVNKILPASVPLTSFSILMSRHKGTLRNAVKGVHALNNIKSGEKILISEGCTHHRQCQDIGTVKLPAWIRKFTAAEPIFEFSSGASFPENLEKYSLIVHCGGCMLNEREMLYRDKRACEENIPMTNYGILIAHINGILKRSIAPLPEMKPFL